MAPQLGEEEVHSIGGMLSIFSIVDPEVEHWAMRVNESSSNEREKAPHTGATDGNTGVGRPEQIGKVDVMEVYSPPRVTVQAKEFGLRAGEAMDLITGYDFNRLEDREEVWKILDRDQPSLVVGSPECKMFSGLQHLTRWNENKNRQLENAKKHVKFICEIYRYQMDKGRWLVHEHSSTATSWSEGCVLALMKSEGVATTITDQCMFVLKTWSSDGGPAIAKERTRFMSSPKEILDAINKKCDGSHTHQPLIHGRAGAAAIYPPTLCKATCKGLVKELRMQRNTPSRFSG